MKHTAALTLLVIHATVLATGPTFSQSSNPLAQQFFDQARQAYAEGDVQKAIDLLSQGVEADPQFVEAYLKLGELLIALDRFELEEAGVVFQKAKEIAPRRGDVRTWLVYVLFELGRYSKAVEESLYARPLATAANLATIAYCVGLAHDPLGNLDEATRWLNEAEPIEAGGFSGLAETALIAVYQRMVTQHQDPELVLKAAVLLYRREPYTEALTTLQALTTETPRLAPAFYWLGLVNVRIAQGFASQAVRRQCLLDARRALERYLKLAPSGEFAGEARAAADVAVAVTEPG